MGGAFDNLWSWDSGTLLGGETSPGEKQTSWDRAPDSESWEKKWRNHGEERAEFFSSIYVSLQSKTFHHRLRMNPFTTLKSMWSPHCEVHNQLLISIKCLISCFLVHPSSYSLLSQNCVQSPLCWILQRDRGLNEMSESTQDCLLPTFAQQHHNQNNHNQTRENNMRQFQPPKGSLPMGLWCLLCCGIWCFYIFVQSSALVSAKLP